MPKITVNMKRIGVFSVLFLLCTFGTASAEVTFSKPDLAEFNTLLFSATTDSPGFGSYTTLFSADLDTNELTQHTFFPENILYLKEVEKLQIQNRYGVFRTGRGPLPCPGRGVFSVCRRRRDTNGKDKPGGRLSRRQISPLRGACFLRLCRPYALRHFTGRKDKDSRGSRADLRRPERPLGVGFPVFHLCKAEQSLLLLNRSA